MTDASIERVLTEQVLGGFGREGDADEAQAAADFFLEQGNRQLAAAALDRAFGLRPDDTFLREQRQHVLESLAVEEHGILFRYIPAGTFVMGSNDREPDEAPAHPVRLAGFWMAETPMTWATYCDLLDWVPPPASHPRNPKELGQQQGFSLRELTKIRLQYCETETLQARDWHAHSPNDIWTQGGQEVRAEELFGHIPRRNAQRPWQYDCKPLIAVSWQDAEALGQRISTSEVQYGLPSEAQWEKAAPGGLIGEKYSWGSQPPDADVCDFGHFGDFVIHPPRNYPPNGYGLYAMCGGVWEWTNSLYDALAYLPDVTPPKPTDEHARVLRGGSWADCADAVTVSFRMGRAVTRSSYGWDYGYQTPNMGFRLCRVERSETS